MWLTPHLRDPQPEGEREINYINYSALTHKLRNLKGLLCIYVVGSYQQMNTWLTFINLCY